MGFREKGIARVYLEVTAQNVGAVRLYQRLGFRRTRTVYKAADSSHDMGSTTSVSPFGKL